MSYVYQHMITEMVAKISRNVGFLKCACIDFIGLGWDSCGDHHGNEMQYN